MQPHLTQLGIDEVPQDIRAIYEDFESHMGAVPPLLKILARRPEYVQLFLSMRTADQLSSGLSEGDRMLLAAKIAALLHSPYAMQNILERNEMKPAVEERKLHAIFHNHPEPGLFSHREGLILDFAQRLQAGGTDAASWGRLHEEFSETDCLDLLMAACTQIFFATLSRGAGLTSLDQIELPEQPES